MRSFVVRFAIVVYESEDSGMGRFTAHCLNMDVLADDDTVEGAVSTLLELIETQLDAAEQHGADPLGRAPERYWQKLGAAQEIPRELMERIIDRANHRNTAPASRVDLREQCELRAFALA